LKQPTATDSGTLKSNASKCPSFLGLFAVDQVEQVESLKPRSVPEFFQLLTWSMFKIKNFPTHVLLTNSWAMKLNAQGVECQSNSVCIAFF